MPRLWASLAIDELERGGSGADRARIVALSQGYGVMSRETSLLVLESQAMFDAFGVDRHAPAATLTGEEALDEASAIGAVAQRSHDLAKETTGQRRGNGRRPRPRSPTKPTPSRRRNRPACSAMAPARAQARARRAAADTPMPTTATAYARPGCGHRRSPAKPSAKKEPAVTVPPPGAMHFAHAASTTRPGGSPPTADDHGPSRDDGGLDREPMVAMRRVWERRCRR